MKLAFVYDRLNKIGGAERILEALHQLWPQAPFYTAVHNPHTTAFTQGWDVRPSFLQHIPFAKTNHELFPWLTPLAFEAFDFKNFDIVISITSAEAKGIITRPETLHICYCLTPARYLWSHTSSYQQKANRLLKSIQTLVINQLRQWDYIAAQRPDYYLAISQTVRQRIKKYYHRDSHVIYPGIDTNLFKPSTISHKLKAKSYYLVVSRLVPYKRIDLAITACNQLKAPLVIVGSGREEARLKRLAGPTITFAGKLTDAVLLRYYQNCRALVFPGEEDFGLAILEAQSVGKPVIAYRQGGATEIIAHRHTGLFFDTLSVSSLIEAMRQFNRIQFDVDPIRHHAQQFDTRNFQHQFKITVNKLWRKHQANFQ